MRPTKDQYFLQMAKLVATRSTCLRRSVGCVLVNARGHVLSTGYNGVAMGMPHCNERVANGSANSDYNVLKLDPTKLPYPFSCPGSHAASGTNLDACQAIHAEQNALDIETAYCTTSPCLTCVKLLMNTSCRRILFLEEYPHGEAKLLWQGKHPGNVWQHYLG
jgi:dCMP deaminase